MKNGKSLSGATFYGGEWVEQTIPPSIWTPIGTELVVLDWGYYQFKSLIEWELVGGVLPKISLFQNENEIMKAPLDGDRTSTYIESSLSFKASEGDVIQYRAYEPSDRERRVGCSCWHRKSM